MIQRGINRHGHERAGDAMTGAIDQRQQATVTISSAVIKVAADPIAGLPDHEAVGKGPPQSLCRRQHRLLQQLGVLDAVHHLPMRVRQFLMSLLQLAGAIIHQGFQVAGVAPDGQGHGVKVTGQVADFIALIDGRQLPIIAGGDRLGRLTQSGQRVQHQSPEQYRDGQRQRQQRDR